MRALARLRRPDGTVFEAGHGAVVGRLWSAEVPIPSPRVSEAHAMVSLRGGALRLLSLRGRFAVDGRVVHEVELSPGLEVELARGVPLTVEDVLLPPSVLGVAPEGRPAVVLHGVASLVAKPTPEVVPGYQPDADAWIWGDGEGWTLERPDAEPVPFSEGQEVHVDGVVFHARAVPLSTADVPRTRMDADIAEPLEIVARHETVHLRRQDGTVVVVSGLQGRMLSELALMACPVAWETLAREVWRDGAESTLLRRRLDVHLARLRKRLAAARIRSDLVRADGCGNLELVLGPEDRVVDGA